MIKNLIKFGIFLIILLLTLVFYLSYFGIDTKKFNSHISEKLTKTDPNLRIELKKVKLFLNVKNFSINISTFEPILHIQNNVINLKKISTNLSINSYLNDDFAIENINLSSSKINIRNLIKSLRIYKNNTQLFILEKAIKNGSVEINLEAKFDKNGKLKNDYLLKGKLKNANLKLLSKDKINNINFAFQITKDKYFFENIEFKFKELDLKSQKISITKKKKDFLVDGEFESSKQKVNPEILFLLLKNLSNEKLNIKELTFGSKNLISFKIDKNFNFSNLNINSNVNLEELTFKPDKKYIYKFDQPIKIKNNTLNIKYNKKKWIISGEGKYSIGEKFENIKYFISNENNVFKFKNEIEFNNIPLKVKLLNYEKNNKQEATLNFEGEYKKNKFFKFNNINYIENENFLKATNISLNKKFKLIKLEKVNLNFININNKKNNLFLSKSNNNYKLISDNFDSSVLLDDLLKDNDDFKFSKIFQNLNTNIFINIKKAFIDEDTYINNLVGDIKFKKNKITNLSLNSQFFNDKELNFSFHTNNNGEKITTLYSGNASPLVKKYKFIKGFEGGNLDFYSIKKNNTSTSKLIINDFKLYKLPVLTKILTLASLQGIADLLTGEGIRFTDFEMNFKSKNKLITIDELYAIGPAISILMNGYIQSGKLVSLRGTLVPATTLNKMVGSIPVLGNILVGKKIGEGVFGVSFKIKGPPNNLKTTVNPIKTLTPRFITRTLEKIKKQN